MSVLASKVCTSWVRADHYVVAVDGSQIPCVGKVTVPLTIDGCVMEVDCLVAKSLFGSVDVIVGMDIIQRFGGVVVTGDHVIFLNTSSGDRYLTERILNLKRRERANDGMEKTFKSGLTTTVAAASLRNEITINDADFEAKFNGSVWSVRWRWKDGMPPKLKNTTECYESAMTPEMKAKFDEEVESWIAKGWLKPYDGVAGEGILPLMAVVQANKNKVRPVMDYREVNEFVECHPGADAAACDETIRRWRRMGEPLKILDLKSAYLQIHIDSSLWPFQQVCYKGKSYCLTRLGFGLCSAPKIMTRILKEVLERNEHVRKNTDNYIDDIFVREDGITAEEVAAHLRRYGLESKPPEKLEGGRVLGLSIHRNADHELVFSRGNELPSSEELRGLSRRQLFSVCGRLVGHYPVCGWLRIACSFAKRESEGKCWDDYVGEKAEGIIMEILCRVRKEDPVVGQWVVANTTEGTVWCDASSLAVGVVLEIGGVVVEDAAWLRKSHDVGHINIAELDAVLKGINLALKWDLKVLVVKTDSATVLSWLRSVLEDDSRVRVSGMSEMLVKRRLSTVKELVDEYDLVVTPTYVKSCENKADALTRVNRVWLKKPQQDICAVSVGDLHAQHHFGVDRSLYLARLVDPSIRREEVERCVRSCWQCCSIDPAPVRHTPGQLSVEESWKRLALDVTHYGQSCYFTVIDCGPSRFAIWRKIRSENAAEISANLSEIFCERGPPDELLMDNSTAFRSKQVAELCKEWNVHRLYRAAYRPSGNGIAERVHRTVKSLAARSKSDPLKVVFWYNLSARAGSDAASAPCNVLFKYSWRHPLVTPSKSTADYPPISVGDQVVVKPKDGRCTSRWSLGRVTGMTSANNVDVDGVPRHILDIRKLYGDEKGEDSKMDEEDGARVVEFESDNSDNDDPQDEGDDVEASPSPRPVRQRRPPSWLSDYEW